MDERSDQTIKRYIILWVMLLCFGAIAFFVLQQEERRLSIKQRNEIIIMHPEQTVEIQESHRFYQNQKKQMYRKLFYVYMFTSGLIVAGTCLIKHKLMKQKVETSEDMLDQLMLQLEQLQKGNFSLIAVERKMSIGYYDCEQWNQVWDKVNELAYYFKNMKDQLIEEENLTKTLVSDISHQLKTPLASLRMSHELLQGEELTQEEKEEFFQKEELEIHRLEVLLQELMNLSRLESHMIQIEPEQGGIKKTITEAVNVVIMKAIAKQIEIRVSIQEDIMVLHDSKWTVEAIANVLDNAIKYSGENTAIQISCHSLPNLLLIEIEDDGIGIRPDEIHKIFQRFYRGKEASKQTKDGAGIGLYLTRRIIEQQGGTIIAKRKQGSGTIFRISLPR